MSASLPKEPSSPVTTPRQHAQCPQMCPSYIITLSPTTTQTMVVQPVLPEPVHLSEEPVSNDLSFDSLRYSLSYNSNNTARNYHDSRNALGTPSPMNRSATELSSLPDRSAIHPSSLHFHPQSCNLNILPENSLLHPESQSADGTPSSSMIIGQPLPQHPKMMLSYILNPSSPVSEKAETPEPNPVLAHTSRSPSPTLSGSEVSSPSTSLFNINGSPVLTRHPGLDSPPHDGSQLSSPTTTPPSSPPPIPQPVPDLPQMVQPPQLLPWEGPPPPGLNPANHQAYQQGGVHWMLAQIFGADIG
ncbi:hypothetical protein Clacol_004433 [Clathrus columnatus]|uniref:Uncharacterized protein n=1 Tax=Clathrus columnatus TaxID=1419009 RepID=A0AAV5A940_9AGAM|nr:hypothetical protein Clacol_004433 [Clathrus columnatus]